LADTVGVSAVNQSRIGKGASVHNRVSYYIDNCLPFQFKKNSLQM